MDEERLARVIYDELERQQWPYLSPFELDWPITVDGQVDFRGLVRAILAAQTRSAALDELGKLDGELMKEIE